MRLVVPLLPLLFVGCACAQSITVRFPDDSPAPSSDTKVQVIMTRTPLRTSADAKQPVETEKEALPLTKVEGSRAAYEAMVTRTPEGDSAY